MQVSRINYITHNSTFCMDEAKEYHVGHDNDVTEVNSNLSRHRNNSDMVEDMIMPEIYIVPVVFAIIFILGVVGNATLIYIVARNQSMRTTPNIFIVSLAVGDLMLILVSVPFTSTYYTFSSWPYGNIICKVNEFLQTLSLGVSVLTLTALSAERYVAIVYPLRLVQDSSTARTLLAAACIWIISIALASVDAVAARTQPTFYHDGEICVTHPSAWPTWYPTFHIIFRFLLYFAIPVVIISTFYILMARILIISSHHMPGEGQAARQMRARKKVAKVVLSFVIVFLICWLPRHIYVFWFEFDPGEYNMFWHVFKITGFCFSFINSCVNPLALYFLSKQFRKYYNRYLFGCCVDTEHQRELGSSGEQSDSRTVVYNFNSALGGPGRPRNTNTSYTSQTAC